MTETLTALHDRVTVAPAVNQIEVHPYFSQRAVQSAAAEQGRSAIPKSADPARIRENLDVFGFALTEAELSAIDALDTGIRGGPDPSLITLDTVKGNIPEA